MLREVIMISEKFAPKIESIRTRVCWYVLPIVGQVQRCFTARALRHEVMKFCGKAAKLPDGLDSLGLILLLTILVKRFARNNSS